MISIKKNDLFWGLALLSVIFILVYPDTHSLFLLATKEHPFVMGFIKIGILATMGELLAIRIISGDFRKPVGIIYRFIIWGFLGMVFVIAFDLFAFGVEGLTHKGILPSVSKNDFLSKLFTAFMTSALINLLFAPGFMAFHRITDTYIDLGKGEINFIINVKLKEVIEQIDWYTFVNFVVLKTIPLFWIPFHTITFMLPSEYRILMAAMLSIALGAILASAKKKNIKKV